MSGLNIETKEKVAIVEMDFNVENTFTPARITSLIETCEELDRSEETNVILLKSAQEKYFSNGLDPEALKTDLDVCFEYMLKMIRNLYGLDKPMVAAVNGYAIAGGAVLSVLADYRIVDTRFKAAFNEVLIGITMVQLLIDIIRETVGPFHAKHLCQRGVTFKAKEALQMGFADFVVQPEELTNRSFLFAKRLAKLENRSICNIKKLSRRNILLDGERFWEEDQKVFNEIVESSSIKVNIQKLLDRSIARTS